jgi:hypothetical protein
MKNLLLSLIIVLTLASCTSTISVTSFDMYNKNIQMVKSDLADKGYNLSGHNQETLSNAVVADISGTAMRNDYYTYDSYSFSNSNGDVAEIMLKYRSRYSSHSDINYMQTIELLGCKTSKASDYDKICESNSAVKALSNNMDKDINIKVYDETKTYLLSLALVFSPLLLLLFV